MPVASLVTAQQAPVLASAVLPLREYLLTALTAAVITFLLIGPVRLLAMRLGAVAWPRGRDVHATPTPRWGGLAMLGGVLGGVLLAYQLPALRLAFDYSDEVVGALGRRGGAAASSARWTTASSSTRSPSSRARPPPRACSCSPACSGCPSGSPGAEAVRGSPDRS